MSSLIISNKSLEELTKLKQHYLHLVHEAKTETESEYNFIVYHHILCRINELVDKSYVRKINQTEWQSPNKTSLSWCLPYN